MKIIFVNRFFYPDHSATSQMLSDLAFNLASRKHNIHVITSRQGYDDPATNYPAEENKDGVTVHRVWTSSFGRNNLPGRMLDYLSFYLSCSFRLLKICNKGDIVVAKTDPPVLSVVVTIVARLQGAMQVNWLQDLFPEVALALGVYGMNSFIGSALQKIRNSSMSTAAMNVVVGECMQERLVNEKIPADKITVIHNWADEKNIRLVAKYDNPLLDQWGLKDKFVIGYSGNLGRSHEYKIILNVAARMRDNKDVIFLFIGAGTGIERLKREQQALGLDNIIFKPYQPRGNLSYSLGLADIQLITLRPEMNGLMVPSKFYGIAAAGKAVLFVGNPGGEIPEILKQADCGISIRPDAAEEMVDTILKLRKNPELLAAMGRNARREFEQNYSSGRAFSEWEQLLSRVGLSN